MSKRKNNWLDMSLTTNVIAKLEIEGLHNWPDAQGVFPEVGFLSNMHRHKWFITAKKRVNHDDRDVEFIMFKRDIEELASDENKTEIEYSQVFSFKNPSETIPKEFMVSGLSYTWVMIVRDFQSGTIAFGFGTQISQGA